MGLRGGRSPRTPRAQGKIVSKQKKPHLHTHTANPPHLASQRCLRSSYIFAVAANGLSTLAPTMKTRAISQHHPRPGINSRWMCVCSHRARRCPISALLSQACCASSAPSCSAGSPRPAATSNLSEESLENPEEAE